LSIRRCWNSILAVRPQLEYLQQIVVTGDDAHGHLSLDRMLESASPTLERGGYQQGRHGVLAVQFRDDRRTESGGPSAS
jgi:hypothetical protein